MNAYNLVPIAHEKNEQYMHTNNILCLNVSLQNMIAWWIRLCRRLHEHDIATKIYYVLFYQIDMNKLIAKLYTYVGAFIDHKTN